MALLKTWRDTAYSETANRGDLQRFWNTYFLAEKEIYASLLKNPDEVVKGTVKADGVHFNPKDEITVAEAAVIINNIVGAKSDASTSAFADEEDIPEWAKSAIVSLNELGIIQKTEGKINPNSTLNRAQTAQIIMSLLEGRGKLGR